jgi:hypothetical protein
VRNCDELVDLLVSDRSPPLDDRGLHRGKQERQVLYATPNFRLKKKIFPTTNAGFFNGTDGFLLEPG